MAVESSSSDCSEAETGGGRGVSNCGQEVHWNLSIHSLRRSAGERDNPSGRDSASTPGMLMECNDSNAP